MPYNRVQVRAFLSKPEIALFEASVGSALKALGPAELGRLVQRARTMRDKSRDLLQRQKLATRARTGSKGGATGDANQRTAQKEAALAQALDRFDAEVEARQNRPAPRTGAAASKRAARTTAPSSTAASRKAAPGKTAGSTSARTKDRGAKDSGAEATDAKAVSKQVVSKKTASKKTASKKTASAKTAASKSRSRPAATVLREALDKKQAADSAAVAGGKRSRRAVVTSDTSSPAPGGVHATTPNARARAVASRLADASLAQVQGHTSAQVRRSQAKRDNKR